MNPNYTIENFEKWLNADKKRKRGLWFWNQIIEKVKSDSDLFDALATGQDQGGWNISDPEFRKQYQFEDYYQVFVEWKKEVDAENGDETEKANEKEKNTNQKDKNESRGIISSPWTWLIIILGIGFLAWKKIRQI